MDPYIWNISYSLENALPLLPSLHLSRKVASSPRTLAKKEHHSLNCVTGVKQGRVNCGCSHGFDGRSCLLKNICQAMEYVSRRDGVIAKILKLLAG